MRMQIANWGAAREAEWGYDGRKGGKIRLERGLNQIEAGIPESFSGPGGDRSRASREQACGFCFRPAGYGR